MPEIDDHYFKVYGKGRGYRTAWKDHSMPPDLFFKALDHLGITPTEILDIGAADGSWINALDQYANDPEGGWPEIRFSGIEINERMAVQNVSRWPLRVTDVREVEFAGDVNEKDVPVEFYDVVCFNGLAYLTKSEIVALLNKLRGRCSVFECGFVSWDNRPLVINHPGDPYEKTFMTFPDWHEFFNVQGWTPHLYNGFWFLTPQLNFDAEHADLDALKPMFLYHNHKLCVHNRSGAWLEHILVHSAPVLRVTMDDVPEEGIPSEILSLSWNYLELHTKPRPHLDRLYRRDLGRQCYYIRKTAV